MEKYRDLIDSLMNYAHDHWTKFITAVLFVAVGWLVGKRRARAEWRNKEFLNRLNFSLNSLRDGRLLIRTLIEETCDEVFLNSVAVDAVAAAAKRTTEKDPLLPLDKDDYWYYLNAVLNEVAEKFADGQMRRDLGLSVTTERYLICLTCERAGPVRTQKIRAMLIQKRILENLPEDQPTLESPNHITRWETLRILAAQWKTAPFKFLEIEICL